MNNNKQYHGTNHEYIDNFNGEKTNAIPYLQY